MTPGESTDPIASELGLRGSAVILVLQELGLSAHAAADAGTVYVNMLSGMYTSARNHGFSQGREVDVSLAPLRLDDLRSVVMHNGREWSKIWLDRTGEQLRFRFDDAEAGVGDISIEGAARSRE